MRGNCVVFAVRLRWRRWRRGREGYLMLRQSRLLSGWLPHVLYAERRPNGSLRIVSFKPLDPKPLPWWLSWRAVWFCGSIKCGD